MKNVPITPSIKGLSTGWEAGVRFAAESGISFRPYVQPDRRSIPGVYQRQKKIIHRKVEHLFANINK